MNKGFTLTEIIVSTAISSFMILIVGTSIVNLVKAQSSLENRSIATQFTSSVVNYLSTESNCSAELSGRNMFDDEQDFSLNRYAGFGDASGSIQAGTQLSPKLRVRSFTIRNKPGFGMQSVRFQAETRNYRLAQVNLNLEQLEANGQWVPLKSQVVELPIIFRSASATLVDSCFYEYNSARNCPALNMVWNASLGRCQPTTMSCQPAGSFVTLSCSPTRYGCRRTIFPYNNPLTNRMSCPSGATAQLTWEKVHTHTASCGKKCTATITNRERTYMCMKCN